MVSEGVSLKNIFKNLLFIIVGFLIPFVFIGLTENLLILCLFLISGLLFFYSNRNPKYRYPINKILLGIAISLCLYFSNKIIQTYRIIPEWDFLCFYLFGTVGRSHSNFYDPVVFKKYFDILQLQSLASSSFIKEIVNVGFWYPPPSMFLFVGLSLFKIKTAYFIWQSIVVFLFLLDVFLLIQLFNSYKTKELKEGGSKLPILLLILLFPHVLQSLFVSQTLTLFLFFLLLMIKYVNKWQSGVFLAILIIIKPLAALFFLYFLFFKKWKIILSFTISGIVIVLATSLYFGIDNFLNYFLSPPTLRIPEYVYWESSSLYVEVLKLQRLLPNLISEGVIKPIYYFLSALLIIATLFAIYKTDKIKSFNPFFVFIPLALMIYPGTLGHYIIILLPVILYFYNLALFKNTSLNFFCIFVFYAIGFYSFSLLNFLLWLFFIYLSFSMRYSKNNSNSLFTKFAFLYSNAK